MVRRGVLAGAATVLVLAATAGTPAVAGPQPWGRPTTGHGHERPGHHPDRPRLPLEPPPGLLVPRVEPAEPCMLMVSTYRGREIGPCDPPIGSTESRIVPVHRP